jgi:hypothetical protein
VADNHNLTPQRLPFCHIVYVQALPANQENTDLSLINSTDKCFYSFDMAESKTCFGFQSLGFYNPQNFYKMLVMYI